MLLCKGINENQTTERWSENKGGPDVDVTADMTQAHESKATITLRLATVLQLFQEHAQL